jgi:hypothetical protein
MTRVHEDRDPMSGSPLAATVLAIAIACAAPALAAPTSDARAPVQSYVEEARLAGTGRVTVLGFRVYDAALYVPPRFDPMRPTAQPFVLELAYARRLEGRGIADASRDEIERLGLGSADQLIRWQRQMAALFPNVESGQRLAGVNVPDTGVRFYFDGRFIGAIEDPAFARAFFSIWLDERTRAPQLRESLLRTAAR